MAKRKGYPKYKLSGVEWLGDVPEGWEVKSLKWETAVMRGASPRPIDDPRYFDEDGEFRWVRISDVTAAGTFLESTEEALSPLGASLSVRLESGSLFLSIAGSVGKACITKVRCCIHDGFVYFPRWRGSPKFLYYIFASGEPYKGLGKLGTQLNLNTDTVGSILLAIPTLHEQTAIANFLDKQTTKIDTLITKKQQLIERLKERRTALISRTVTKGLPPEEAARHGLPINPKMKTSGVEWLGDVPEGWGVKRLKFVFPRLKSGVSVNAEDTPTDEGWPGVLKTSSVYGNKFTASENKRVFDEERDRVACSVTRDSLVISRMNTPELVGNCGFVDADYPNLFLPDRLWIARFDQTNILRAKFGWYLIISDPIVRITGSLATGTSGSMKNLSQEAFLGIDVPIPSCFEQTAIANFLDRETNKVDSLIAKIESAIAALKDYRTALITAAVTGKIDVRGEKSARDTSASSQVREALHV